VLTNPSVTVQAIVTELIDDSIKFYIPVWKRIIKKKTSEKVKVGASISVDYLSQPDKVFWKDRLLFRISNISYPEQ
jgi:hypothetical protein